MLPSRIEDIWFLLAVLNGQVANFVFTRTAKPFRGNYLAANRQFIAPLPVPPATPEQREEIGAMARTLQSLHTRRRDAAAALRRRIEGTARRKRPVHFLFPAIAAPGDRDEAPAEAQRAHDEEVTAATAALAASLGPDVALRAVFEQGELRLHADGAPILRGLFLSDDEGPLIAAQWNAFVAGFDPGHPKAGPRLVEGLRRLFVSAPRALAEQVIALQAELDALEADIVANEEALEARLRRLYGLTKAEQALVWRGTPSKDRSQAAHGRGAVTVV